MIREAKYKHGEKVSEINYTYGLNEELLKVDEGDKITEYEYDALFNRTRRIVTELENNIIKVLLLLYTPMTKQEDSYPQRILRALKIPTPMMQTVIR